MFRTIKNLPRTKRQWTKLASGIQSDPSSDLVRKRDANVIAKLLAPIEHVADEDVIDFRQSGAISHSDRDTLALHSLAATLLNTVDDPTDVTGIRRAPIVVTDSDWDVLVHANGTGPSAYKRLMATAEQEGRDIVTVSNTKVFHGSKEAPLTAREPTGIPYRDPARMHFIAEIERTWIRSGPLFDEVIEHGIPRTAARDTTIYAHEKERAKRKNLEPRIVSDPDGEPCRYVLSKQVSAVSDYQRAADQAVKDGVCLVVLDALPPLPQPEAA